MKFEQNITPRPDLGDKMRGLPCRNRKNYNSDGSIKWPSVSPHQRMLQMNARKTSEWQAA
jgi:hypothetical protein